jgi:hypothetical protein
VTVSVFDEGDDTYFEWMHAHPQGFVVNTERIPSSRYAILHRSNCFHITSMKSLKPGAYTERQYIKVCSDAVAEMVSWLVQNRPQSRGFSDVCASCAPKPTVSATEYPEQVDDETEYWEGATRTVRVNAYERNAAARQKCIAHWGARCSACEMSFEVQYGDIGTGFIHVHHLRSLSEVNEHYQVDPINDLRPVCPNCHAMLHRRQPPLTIEELSTRLKR